MAWWQFLQTVILGVGWMWRGILRVLISGVLLIASAGLGCWWLLEALGVRLAIHVGLWGDALAGLVILLAIWWGVWTWWEARFHLACRRVGLVVTEQVAATLGQRIPHTIVVVPRVFSVRRVNSWTERVGVDLPAGITAERMQVQADALASGMGWHAVRVTKDARRVARVWLEVARHPLPLTAPLSHLPVPSQPLEFPVGVSPWGPLLVDLAACPHLLIAGETGAGKSTFLHSFLTSLLDRPSVDQGQCLLLWLIDLKGGLEFLRYEAAPSVVQVAGDWETALAVLLAFVEELERRLSLLRSVRCASVEEFWRRFPERRAELLPGVLVVDELAQLTLAPVSRPEHSKALGLLHRATSVGRALGMHVVVATQRPDMEVLPGNIKANIPAVLCFRVRDETNSRLVLDDAAASQLPAVPGRAIWRYGADLTEVQAPCLDEVAVTGKQAQQGPLKAAKSWWNRLGRTQGVGAPRGPAGRWVPEHRVGEEMGKTGFP
jgi:hypothetical protein